MGVPLKRKKKQLNSWCPFLIILGNKCEAISEAGVRETADLSIVKNGK